MDNIELIYFGIFAMTETYEHFGLMQVMSNTIFRNFTVENVGFRKVFSFGNFPQFPQSLRLTFV